MNNVAIMDKQLYKRKELLESTTAIHIYCDASFKDDIMVSGILIIGPGHDKKLYKNITNHKNDVILGEVEAIKLALKYVKDNFIKEAIIYTEINSVINAYPFLVMLNMTNYSRIPFEHRKIAIEYKKFWNYFRHVHKTNCNVTINKVKSENNPAHSIVCLERERLIKKRSSKNFFKYFIAKLGTALVKWGE